MNEDKKLMSAIVIVAIAILLVSGGTLAYWQWSTSQLQGTLVNGSPAGDLDKTKMYIDFPENELTNLYPTSDCDPNGISSWVSVCL